MSGNRITLDTNILIYAANIDAGHKHLLAIKVLERALQCDCVLTLQSLSEFFAAVTRKGLLSPKLAAERVEDLSTIFPIITPKEHSLKSAIEAVIQHKLAFWDAMLWATAQDAGIHLLLSEDFQHGQLIKRVRIINPFVENDYWSID
jgi:predicted nucleic acid-binding protein